MSGGHSLLTNFGAFAILTLAGCLLIAPLPAVAQGTASDLATDAQSVPTPTAPTAAPNKQTRCGRKTQSQLSRPRATDGQAADDDQSACPDIFDFHAEVIKFCSTATEGRKPRGLNGDFPFRLTSSANNGMPSLLWTSRSAGKMPVPSTNSPWSRSGLLNTSGHTGGWAGQDCTLVWTTRPLISWSAMRELSKYSASRLHTMKLLSPGFKAGWRS